MILRHTAARMAPANRLIAIIGATGTGKSQLAVDIARRCNGEVVNADAMQLYTGLPIITNKMPEHERAAVPHHLLGTIALDQETWTVTEFVSRARDVLADIHGRGKVPVLVGGSHYYVQSLLFEETLVDGGDERGDSSAFPILDEPTPVVLARLREVDPAMAQRWHPNDRRKIQRSLEIFLKKGKPASQTYAEQRLRKQQSDPDPTSKLTDSRAPPSGMRYSALLFWLHADNACLRARLDARVGNMLDAGLLDEVAELDALRKQREAIAPVDLSHGIWVSIGYKEFEVYQHALAAANGNTTGKGGEVSNAQAKELALLRDEAIDRTRVATRQYAKRQIRWLRIKMLRALGEQARRSLFILDGTDVSAWDTAVSAPGVRVAQAFLAGEELPDAWDVVGASEEARALLRLCEQGGEGAEETGVGVRRECELCGTIAVTAADWEKHTNSRKHKIRTKKTRDMKAKEVTDVVSGPDKKDGAGRKREREETPDAAVKELERTR
ncbi:uncharacterized protein K452DRAFT_287568 [Aplosporella prunicola CBS 121167]|uniref:tRNA dimethylallyltransferase n=1 Tax=Aplosporella prunicola CBS 121167 TaxID=1176127 RepID=A0A6A6BGG6_9PEZI|nr:uncharacterized protein K452DRAFT_287568 [Aplosporella prunicola CBS 121167]KAF2141621.1 hypothetical protein K452DRAFT_287568 [Aplosporella prunicola CBS 121167]